MESVCFSFELVPGTEAEYDRRHRELWPELASAFRAAGFERFSLFRDGVRVVGFAECAPESFSEVGASDVGRAWADWLDELIVSEFTYYAEIWRLES